MTTQVTIIGTNEAGFETVVREEPAQTPHNIIILGPNESYTAIISNNSRLIVVDCESSKGMEIVPPFPQGVEPQAGG